MRKVFLVFSLTSLALTAILAFINWKFAFLLVFFLPLIGMGLFDMYQSRHAIRPNFPLVGRLRYLLESIGPEIRQYFVETDIDGRPFDRLQRGYDTGYSQPEIQAGIAMMQKLDWKNTFADVDSAVAEAKKAGKVGIVGYCWGGTVAWRAAANTAGLAASAPYYGGGMPNFKDEKPKVPTLCHFGELDQSPTPEQAKEILARHPEVEGHFYANAGHGFNCDQRGSYNAEAAKLARERTLAFFRKHLG